LGAPLVDRIPFAKIVIALAVICVVSVGLCGVGIAFSTPAYGTRVFGHLSGWMLASGIVCFWASLLGLAVSIAVWVILAIAKGADGGQQG
jgi:hypothetical protein